MPFYWTEFHQKAFEQVKQLLIKPQYYIYPDLEVDLYCIVTPLRLTQAIPYGKMQDGKPRLLGYASKFPA